MHIAIKLNFTFYFTFYLKLFAIISVNPGRRFQLVFVNLSVNYTCQSLDVS